MTTYLTQRNSNQDFQCDQNKPCSITKSYSSRTIVHPKLEMTEPGDHDEQEADVIANTIAAGGKISRKISGGSGSSGITVSNQMESQLSHLQGGGQAMPTGLRNMMERGFGQDFSHVRLHTDSEAASLSSSIHAKAFTHGNDIYFNNGQYSPNTSEGQKLMAHELTHVVQGGGKIGRDGFGDFNFKISPELCLDPEFLKALPIENQIEFMNMSIKTCPSLQDLFLPPFNPKLFEPSNDAFSGNYIPPVGKDSSESVKKVIAKGIEIIMNNFVKKKENINAPKPPALAKGHPKSKDAKVPEDPTKHPVDLGYLQKPTEPDSAETFKLNDAIELGKISDYYFIRINRGKFSFDIGHTKDPQEFKEFWLGFGCVIP